MNAYTDMAAEMSSIAAANGATDAALAAKEAALAAGEAAIANLDALFPPADLLSVDGLAQAFVDLAIDHPKSTAVLAVAGAVGVAYAATQAVIAAAPSVKQGIGVAAFSVSCAAESGYNTVCGWFSSAAA